MRIALAGLSALLLAGCNANQPIYSSPSTPMASSKPAQVVAGCISERFMSQNLHVTTSVIDGGSTVQALADGIVAVRADVRTTASGSAVSLNSDWLLRSTYEPLARSCL